MLRNIVAAFSYLGCVVLGAAVGAFIGYMAVVQVVMNMLDPSIRHSIINDGSVVTIANCGAIFGALYGIGRFIWGYELYNDLLAKKRVHRHIYYPVRKWYQVPVDTGTDIAWAVGYVFFDTFFPPFGTVIGIGLIDWGFQSIVPKDLSFAWFLVWLVYVFYIIPYLMNVFSEVSHHLFQPKQLLTEIDEAPLIIETLRRRQEEERRWQERLRYRDDDLRGGRF